MLRFIVVGGAAICFISITLLNFLHVIPLFLSRTYFGLFSKNVLKINPWTPSFFVVVLVGSF